MAGEPDPLWAVLAPPHARALRARLGLADEDPIEVEFSGWSKRVVLTDSLALLFPRDHHNVEPLAREARALRAVASAGLGEVPRIVDEWDDPELSPYPILVVNRLRGQSLEDHLRDAALLKAVLERTAQLAARWHTCDPVGITSDRDFGTPIAALLDPTSPPDALAALGVDAKPSFVEAIQFARTLDPVLLHGDLHEAQLLVDDQQLTGVIDWQTASLGHPYLEFNFGEWGTPIWRERRDDLPALRRVQWNAYSSARGLPAQHADVFEWVWCMHQLAVVLRNEANGSPHTDITGTVAEAREAFDAASARVG